MYIKYIVNYWSVCLYHDIHSKTKVIYFEQGLVARGGFCLYPYNSATFCVRTLQSAQLPGNSIDKHGSPRDRSTGQFGKTCPGLGFSPEKSKISAKTGTLQGIKP